MAIKYNCKIRMKYFVDGWNEYIGGAVVNALKTTSHSATGTVSSNQADKGLVSFEGCCQVK
jgi:hypothetical protein